jgi:pimeloyl-ACP methyl ester carboxylesterase
LVEFIGERVFNVRGLILAAKEWGALGSKPVIALHGWLDNAASFDLLLPSLEDTHVLAIDSAGHGQSAFRSSDAGYELWQEIPEVIEIADQMGWADFALIGHSRGAVIAGLIAGTFPKRINGLVMIDAHMPVPALVHNSAKQMAKSIRDDKRFATASPSYFNSFEDAVEARAKGFLSLDRDAAEILARRGVREDDKGFYWHNDQRLKSAASIKFTKEQINSFLKAISAPSLLIYAQNSLFTQNSEHTQFSSLMDSKTVVTFPGTHHLHMERQASEVALAVQKFFTSS